MKLCAKVVTEVLSSSLEAVIIVDSNGMIVFANERAGKIFGYPVAEMVGNKVEMLMPQKFRDRHAKLRSDYHKAPRRRPLVSGVALKGQRRDGRTFDADIALTPVNTDDGVFIAGTIRDVSVDDTSEAYFRNVLESAPDAMIIIDHYGKISIVNGQAETMFRYTREEMLGQDIEMLLPDGVREKHVSHRARYADDPRLRPMGAGMELRGRRQDGSEFPVEISLSPVTSASGAFVSSVIRDVTERKQMEAELIAARQAAERANKANTAFLAAASHDLRQPVQALSLLSGALRRTVKVPLALEMVESQQHSLDAMTNLLNSLLDISRLDAGAVEPELEDFPIQRLVDRLSAEFSRQARQKGLQFAADGCDKIVRSDPHLVGEIIQNFVSNAIRYTDTGNVHLKCREVNGHLCIDVSDSGVGIEAAQINEIFKEFYQVKTTRADKEGFGLGLAIVKRMADLLEHEIKVKSTPGSGSTFSVCIPTVQQHRSGVDREKASAEKDAAREIITGTILLIEDDVKVAHAWGLLLEAEGFVVATAASAKEAKAVAKHLTVPPQLIISDFHLLDGSTGVEAVAAIRDELASNIPAFIVSGDTSKMVQDAKSTSNCLIMNKPVNTDRLLNAARSAIVAGVVPAD
jgi:protein-histidine pros-kinase